MTPLPRDLAARRDELRRAVARRALQLRLRRGLVVVGPCVVALVVGLWVTSLRGGSPTRIHVAGRTATTQLVTTTSRPPARATTTTVAVTTSATTVAGAPTTVAVAPTTAAPPPTTVAPVTATTFDTSTCHNSYDPRCGGFSWQPPVANHGLTVHAAVSDVGPAAGEQLSVTIDASDADAVPTCVTASFAGHAVALTDSVGHSAGCGSTPCPGPPRYGPWSPPPPSGGTRRVFGSFTASGTGAQTLVVAANSGSGCAYLPYASAAATTVTITVH